MCVILELKPNVDFNFDKLSIACEINSDGYGLLVQDRGKMECIKSYNPKGNDPEEVMKLLDDAKGLHRLLHLRFSTAGSKNVDNCHPFQVLNKADHGVDLFFMHNGTLMGFSKTGDSFSDSYHFNEKILKPLIASLRYSHGPTYLEQDYLKYLLKEVAGHSVFTLFDNQDNLLKIENSSCFSPAEGIWASNSYSFKETHSRYNSNYSSSGQSAVPFRAGGTTTSGTSPGKTPTSTTTPTTTSKNALTLPNQSINSRVEIIDSKPVISKQLNLEADHLKELLHETLLNRPTNTTTTVSFVGFRKPTFLELTNLSDWSDLKYFDQETVEEMVELLPELSTTLILDLINLLFVEVLDKKKDAA